MTKLVEHSSLKEILTGWPLTICGLILLLVLMPGCKKVRTADPLFPWPVSGVPLADSITVEMDRNIARGEPSIKLSALLDSMRNIAQGHPDKPIIRNRYEIFKAYELYADGDTVQALGLYDKAMKSLDAKKYPYDVAKWRQFYLQSSPLPYQPYEMAIENYVYFSDIGDDYEKARAGIVLGNTYQALNDSAKAVRYYEESRKVAVEHEWDNLLWTTNLNLSLSNDSVANDSILRSMLKLPMVRRSAERAMFVLTHLFDNSRQQHWLDSALALQRYVPLNKRKTPTLLYLKGEQYIAEQKFDSATLVFKAAADSMSGGYNSADTTMILFRRAEAYEYEGKLDSAVSGLDRAFQALLNYYAQRRIPDVYLQETKMKIEFARREEQLTSQRRLLVAGLILMAVAATAVVIVIYYRKKASEKRLKAEMYADKLRHAQEISQLRQLVIEEKNALISEVEKMVDKGRKDDVNVDPLVAGLSRTLSIHKGNEEDRTNMVKMKEEVDDTLLDRLRNEFPTLTRGDFKLIKLLTLGLDNHQIARNMNISMESVWKARYRLRTRLQLTADAQLEDFLKDYARHPEH